MSLRWPSALAHWQRDPRVRDVLGALSKTRCARAGSVTGGAQAVLIAALTSNLKAPVVVICSNDDEVDAMGAHLETLLHSPPLPTLNALAGEVGAIQASDPHLDSRVRFLHWATTVTDRLPAQDRLAIASAAGLCQHSPPPSLLERYTLKIDCGTILPTHELEAFLEGGQRTPMVAWPGDWSRRGGIVDIYPYGDGPYRLEFDDERLVSIRTLDVDTQCSVDIRTQAHLVLPPPEVWSPKTNTKAACTLDYLPANTVVMVSEPAEFEAFTRGYTAHHSNDHPLPFPVVAQRIRQHPIVEVSTLPIEQPSIDFATQSVTDIRGVGLSEIVASLARLLDRVRKLVLFTAREGEIARLGQLLTDASTKNADAEWEVLEGAWSAGFEDPTTATAVISTSEVFGRPRLRRATRQPYQHTALLDTTADLKVGDLLVHASHGLGRYVGIEALEDRDGNRTDYLAMGYAENAKLYVPLTKIALVQRYVGAKGHRPELSRLGGDGWRKRTARVKSAVADLAASLVDTQAKRRLMGGISHPVSGDWQSAFDAAFPYDETPDQLEAAARIDVDLARRASMDRLICGDVGYGKTELAMRAAFRVVMGKRQVAVLVPTTILAEQHLRTFRARMAAFPVRIACLSRFRSTAETRSILKELADGKVDIVIGTHRLISPDVHLKNLGLLVIDEEQRFGVKHKEAFKQLRAAVDVLTMTATPIPRTLHLALLGIKDISSLDTPPFGRIPIATKLAPNTDETIRAAILAECDRGGQVFFVHNRVRTLAARAQHLAKLVPEASFAMVHGQMHEHTIEEAMVAFVSGEVDVLVCTTIIESGLDIPRANTMLIDDPQRFGLAELHQLRGRIGRYIERGYAYMLLPSIKRLSRIARERLKTIEELSGFGAGFRIAMRDLEIRGAGNILGTTQSGHIATVGYELYCKLLREAVLHLASQTDGPGRPQATAAEAEAADIDIPLDAYIPLDYIPHVGQRIGAYRSLSEAKSHAELAKAIANLRDRYGSPPPPLQRLLALGQLGQCCRALGIRRLHVEGAAAVLTCRSESAAARNHIRKTKRSATWPETNVAYLHLGKHAELEPLALVATLTDWLQTKPRRSR